MVFFLTAVLIGSCAGMCALLYAKHWELTTGRVVFAEERVRLARLSCAALYTVEHRAPALARAAWMYALAWLRGSARAALARMLLNVEHALERTLHFLRHGLAPSQGGSSQVSVFLQEVAEHKKRLMRRAPHRNRASIL